MFDFVLLCAGASFCLSGLGGVSEFLGAVALGSVFTGLSGLAMLIGVPIFLYNLIDKFVVNRGKIASKSRTIRVLAALLAVAGLALTMATLFIPSIEAARRAGNAAAPPTKQMKSDDGSVQVTLPDRWAQVRPPDGMLLAAQTSTSILFVLRDSFPPREPFDLGSHAEAILQTLFSDWPDATRRPAKLRAVNGLPAAWTELQGTEPKSKTQYRVSLVVIQANDSRYQLRIMVPEAEWASQQHALRAIVESLHVSQSSPQ